MIPILCRLIVQGVVLKYLRIVYSVSGYQFNSNRGCIEIPESTRLEQKLTYNSNKGCIEISK